MRVKTGTTRKARHHQVLKRTKGMRMSKGRLYKVSKEAALHAGQYAFIGRKNRKRDFRKLWIQRISAALKTHAPDLKYSRFIKLLQDKKVALNRQILAQLAITDPTAFKAILDKVQKTK